uniref:Reverse transcriptase domain-containing protein n=1 Tax=Trichogramma kaykai TaxID=54128 RepID=A0ABD2W1H7_9HYME
MLSQSHTFYDILSQFPTTYDSQFRKAISESSVCHYLHTEGHPVSEKARRLSPEKLKIAKAYFADMQSKGLITPSNSPWASPIHMVLKKDGTWRICGDYRRLNTVTIPDKYPVKRLQDFTAILANTKIFFYS